MAPLAVDPEALSAAGSAVVTTGDGLAANLTVLTAGFGANTGLDAAGTVFGLAYQDAAESLLKAAAAAVNACRHSGALIQQGASNYSKADVASALGGGAGVLEAPAEAFSTPEEAGVTPPTEEELARARKLFDEFQRKVDAVAPEDRITEVSPKFWDDISGTEYERRQDS